MSQTFGDTQFDEFIGRYHAALGEFVTGDPEPLKGLYSRQDDVVIANPFGPPTRGWKQAAEVMERAAGNYTDGEIAGFDEIAKYVTSGLAYTVEVERYRARVGGGQEMASIAIRVTTVFRPENGVWRVVHRHADPITSFRPADSVIQA